MKWVECIMGDVGQGVVPTYETGKRVIAKGIPNAVKCPPCEAADMVNDRAPYTTTRSWSFDIWGTKKNTEILEICTEGRVSPARCCNSLSDRDLFNPFLLKPVP